MADIPQNIPLGIYPDDLSISESDRRVLRSLAERVARLAAREVEKEKAELWTRHNDLKPVRPLFLCSPENAWHEIVAEKDLECVGSLARTWERVLRQKVFWGDRLRDDWPIVAAFDVGYVFSRTNWGLEEHIEKHESEGSYAWEAPVKSLEDVEKLRFMEIVVDYERSNRLMESANETFGDFLPVRRRQMWVFSYGLSWELTKLRGLEQCMIDMYENPELIHRLMAFLRDGFAHILDFLEEDGLLTPNHGDDYCGSGGIGYTTQLPADDFAGTTRAKDTWGLAESQEFVGVSPKMFEEFVFPYQLPLISRFGLSYYGCCEPVHDRWHVIKRIPNLRRVSVSPWCDREKMVEYLGDRCVYCLKPNPSPLAQSRFDLDATRKYISESLDMTKGCCVEILMKDTHTLARDPQRVIDWSRIVREEIEKRYS